MMKFVRLNLVKLYNTKICRPRESVEFWNPKLEQNFQGKSKLPESTGSEWARPWPQTHSSSGKAREWPSSSTKASKMFSLSVRLEAIYSRYKGVNIFIEIKLACLRAKTFLRFLVIIYNYNDGLMVFYLYSERFPFHVKDSINGYLAMFLYTQTK